MDMITWGKGPFTSAMVVKGNNAGADKTAIMNKYMKPLSIRSGLPLAATTQVLKAYYPAAGNLRKAILVEAAAEILDHCDTQGLSNLFVADSKYFEYLSGVKGLEKQIGKFFSCVVEGYKHLTIFPVLNHVVIDMSPEKNALQTTAFQTIGSVLNGTYEADKEFEFDIYNVLSHPAQLGFLLDKPILACDIETTGLRFETYEVATIAFAWSDTEALTIPIHHSLHEANGFTREQKWKKALKEFFLSYRGKLVFHNA